MPAQPLISEKTLKKGIVRPWAISWLSCLIAPYPPVRYPGASHTKVILNSYLSSENIYPSQLENKKCIISISYKGYEPALESWVRFFFCRGVIQRRGAIDKPRAHSLVIARLSAKKEPHPGKSTRFAEGQMALSVLQATAGVLYTRHDIDHLDATLPAEGRARSPCQILCCHVHHRSDYCGRHVHILDRVHHSPHIHIWPYKQPLLRHIYGHLPSGQTDCRLRLDQVLP